MQTTSLPNMSDILSVAHKRGVELKLKTFGPVFQVVATSREETDSPTLVGQANGFIKPWWTVSSGPQLILHLDTIRMTKASASKEGRPVFGLALLIGALAIRHGYDCGCVKAELLAINDNHLYHSKLVRYYKRLGFEPVYEVTGDSLRDLPHMLVWGGIGTRMDAQILRLLVMWSKFFNSN